MKTTYPKATKTVYPIICQIVNVRPNQFVAQTAAEHKVVSRTFSPKSHVAAELGITSQPWLSRAYLSPLMERGHIAQTLPRKPRSPLQRYRLSRKGRFDVA